MVGVRAGCRMALYLGRRWDRGELVVEATDGLDRWSLLAEDAPQFDEKVNSVRCSCSEL